MMAQEESGWLQETMGAFGPLLAGAPVTERLEVSAAAQDANKDMTGFHNPEKLSIFLTCCACGGLRWKRRPAEIRLDSPTWMLCWCFYKDKSICPNHREKDVL